ncbi:MAG TPA: glutamate 5-kinase [Ignavibacteriaceae bacterium]|nr:glutamate 5-kinase [Ignavibacteriaceae bacterium]
MKKKYKRIIIKIGSNVLALENGLLNLRRIQKIVEQIVELKNHGIEVIIVSSGAVASGRSYISLPDNYDAVSKRQVLASIGQIKLITKYQEYFEKHNLICAQVLVSKEDFRDRNHYLNMQNCISVLLQNNVIPIVNENDVISITELMFTDNDELAGLIASMVSAEALILLTSVDGIFDGDPKNSDAKVIPVITPDTTNFTSFVNSGKSTFGRGGMITKCHIASRLTSIGINVHVANGGKENVILDILNGVQTGTIFPAHKKTSGIKKWLAHSKDFSKGSVTVTDGAKSALLSDKAISLLMIGVHNVDGYFQRGDIIKIIDGENNFIGWGMSNFSSEKTLQLMGQKKLKPLIHYDYLFINKSFS